MFGNITPHSILKISTFSQDFFGKYLDLKYLNAYITKIF